MTIKMLVTATALAAIMAAPALAQVPGGGGGMHMTPEQRAAAFDKGDANKDGKLDKAEWTTTLPEQAQAMADQIWGRVDADGDGSVTKEQYLALRMGPRPPQ